MVDDISLSIGESVVNGAGLGKKSCEVKEQMILC